MVYTNIASIMTSNIHDWIRSRLVGQRLRFKCDCTGTMDIVGIVRDAKAMSGEIVLTVEVEGGGGKTIRIGENHPGMKVSRA